MLSLSTSLELGIAILVKLVLEDKWEISIRAKSLQS